MKKTNIIPIIVFIILLLGMALFPYIPAYIFKIDLNTLPDNMKIAYQISCCIGYMIIMYTLYHKKINHDLNDFKKNFDDYFGIIAKYYLIGYAVMVVSNILIGLFVTEANAANEESIRNMIELHPLFTLFEVSIYAPFIEELIFRKSIYDIFSPYKKSKYTKYLYIIISGLIFSSLHVLGASDNTIDYLYIIPYLGLGIAFASIYHKTENIFTTITIHMTHNTIAMILYFLVGV